jgi:hypothetical protein
MSALPPKADIGASTLWTALFCRLPPIIALLGSYALGVGSRWRLLENYLASCFHACLASRVSSTNWPSAKSRKPISALSPQVSTVLIWSVFSTVTCTLVSDGLVVGKHPQNTLVCPLVHTSRLDWPGTVPAPFQSSAQFLDTPRRAVPAMAHSGLIGDASAFAASEKPNAVIGVPTIQDACWAIAFAARKHEVTPAKMRFPPIAANDLLYGVQRSA